MPHAQGKSPEIRRSAHRPATLDPRLKIQQGWASSTLDAGPGAARNQRAESGKLIARASIALGQIAGTAPRRVSVS
jgi:hypothetical protein